MRLGRARLDYITPGGAKARLEGCLPLTDGYLRLEPFGGSGEAGVRLEKAEPRIRLLHLHVELEDVNLRDRFLANGFQSWSETRLLGPDDRLEGLRLLGFLKPYGDYGWVDYPGRPGCFHSHWLTYTVDAGAGSNSVTFLGSLNEATAYTVFRIDYGAGRLGAEVDVEGMEPRPGDVLAHVFCSEGGGAGEESPLLPIVRAYATRLSEVWKDELAGLSRGEPGPTPLLPRLDHRPGGWNSWYNYYGKVTRKDILAETAALRAAGFRLDFVQIDDGWQAEVGDWLSVSPRFGGRMIDLASAIRDAGFEPGIWVAPLVASKRAEVFRKGWVKPWKAGWNPGWGSSISALDLGRPEVLDYVRRVGDTFCEWGFGLVKADFLYAAAVRPWGGRTRAQRMRQAMRLLRETMPGRLLGCGVPLASAVGLCDWCRLGADTTAKWEDGLLTFFGYRERPSTRAALRTILNRWFMDGTLFVLDPDVFIFGPGRLTDTERRTIYEVMTTVGGMQSFSDSVASLTPEVRSLVAGTFPLPDTRVLSMDEVEPDLFRVRSGRGNGRARTGQPEQPVEFFANLADRPQRGIEPHATRR